MLRHPEMVPYGVGFILRVLVLLHGTVGHIVLWALSSLYLSTVLRDLEVAVVPWSEKAAAAKSGSRGTFTSRAATPLWAIF